ncbi:aminoglycoside phosphotransferase family protein [Paenibacillus sp. JDR-2]|uniref:aminoglycoside phosphotransferase family protein n=1 Tax=Paenibacillus sp. (strain JDR-2) TaxID=324057 RepID=UPI00016632C2|nr:aminoglycoside phosphotransferase family protein [Paenibacillus sp. JDR-2]ACT01759.1 aminoglycoside phosphotransferase [Paenibacillus sp. JDR-2]
MTAYEKPVLPISEIEHALQLHLGPGAADLTPLSGGNISNVFAFTHKGKGYVVKFSDLKGAYETERYVSELLTAQGVPFPKCLALEKTERLSYTIMERIEGRNLSDFTVEEQKRLLPELFDILTGMSKAEVQNTNGYGWIEPDGNGAYSTWRDFVIAVNAEEQTGFWENWQELYRTSFLEREVYEEIYNRLMTYVSYNAPYRSFVHGDFHQWNVLSDGRHVTGIIDGNFLYGDRLIDLAVLDRHMPWNSVISAYEAYQEKSGIEIPQFKERLIGAYYFKGLDGLRFCAKMGWNESYQVNKEFLLNLEA